MSLIDREALEQEPCEDAVSRDSVKFLLCKETCHPGAFCPDGFCREICEKVNALPSVTPKQRMGEWIPVTERLPEERGFYLVKVCAEYRPIRIYAFSPWDMDKERKFWINDGDSHSHVFNHFVEAWMPLPEPYRAERRIDEGD